MARKTNNIKPVKDTEQRADTIQSQNKRHDIEPGWAPNIAPARHMILSLPETRYGTSKGLILEPASDNKTTTKPARKTIQIEKRDVTCETTILCQIQEQVVSFFQIHTYVVIKS